MIGDFKKAVLYTGIFLAIFISFKHLLYSLRTSGFWRESADLFIVRKRREDLIINIIIASIPTIHIPNKMYPVTDGVSLFTERAKLFIQFVVPDKPVSITLFAPTSA